MATEYIDASINPADYIEVWEAEDTEHGKQLVMAVDDLKCLPPADVRPVVHGRWIVAEPRGPHAGFRWADQYGECSECHEILEWPYKMNFCPNCGSYNGGDADG